jgi:hypothetical protein
MVLACESEEPTAGSTGPTVGGCDSCPSDPQRNHNTARIVGADRRSHISRYRSAVPDHKLRGRGGMLSRRDRGPTSRRSERALPRIVKTRRPASCRRAHDGCASTAVAPRRVRARRLKLVHNGREIAAKVDKVCRARRASARPTCATRPSHRARQGTPSDRRPAPAPAPAPRHHSALNRARSSWCLPNCCRCGCAPEAALATSASPLHPHALSSRRFGLPNGSAPTLGRATRRAEPHARRS